MSIFDLILLTILIILVLRGIWKGMVSQIVSVASYIVSWIIATRFGSLLAPTIPLEAPWDQVVAMAIVFGLSLLGFRFVRAVLEEIVKKWQLQKFNSLLGGVLGFAKGLLLCMIVTFFLVMFSEISRDIVFRSQSGYRLVGLITRISVFVPKDSFEFVHTQLARFQEKVEEAVPDKESDEIPIQSSKTMQQLLTHMEQVKEKTEGQKEESRENIGSLWSAVSRWWKGKAKAPVSEAVPELPSSVSQPVQNQLSDKNQGVNSPLIPAVSYTAPSPASSFSGNLPSTVPIRDNAVDSVRDFSSGVSPVRQAVQSVLVSAVEGFSAENTGLSFSDSTPLSILSPLSEAAAILAEPMLSEPETVRLPAKSASFPVGLDVLLRNSTPAMKSKTSAKVFRKGG